MADERTSLILEELKQTNIVVGTMYAAVLGVVRRVVRTLVDIIEELPDFADLEPDDPSMRVVEKLRDVLDIIDPTNPTEPLRTISSANRAREARGHPSMNSATCNEGCPCWGRPTDRPRVCPICDHPFQGNGWDGIDRHYRAKHEKPTDEPYEDWWDRICQQHKG